MDWGGNRLCVTLYNINDSLSSLTCSFDGRFWYATLEDWLSLGSEKSRCCISILHLNIWFDCFRCGFWCRSDYIGYMWHLSMRSLWKAYTSYYTLQLYITQFFFSYLQCGKAGERLGNRFSRDRITLPHTQTHQHTVVPLASIRVVFANVYILFYVLLLVYAIRDFFGVSFASLCCWLWHIWSHAFPTASTCFETIYYSVAPQ